MRGGLTILGLCFLFTISGQNFYKKPAKKIMFKVDVYYPGLSLEARLFHHVSIAIRPHLKPSSPFHVDFWNVFYTALDLDFRFYFRRKTSKKSFNRGFYIGAKGIQLFRKYGNSIDGFTKASKSIAYFDTYFSPVLGVQYVFKNVYNVGAHVGPLYSFTPKYWFPVYGEINLGIVIFRK